MSANMMRYRVAGRLYVLPLALLIQLTGARALYAAPQSEVSSSESMNLGRPLESRSGETCIVCNRAVRRTDRVYVIDGQRVPVHQAGCELLLKRDSARYLASLKPRGAFLGAVTQTEEHIAATASWAWVTLAIFVLLGLLFGGLCSYLALNRGLPPLPWFLAGFCLNIIGLAAVLTRRARGGTTDVPRGLAKIPVTYAPRPCTRCGKLNHPGASSCAACSLEIEPAVASEASKARLRARSTS